MNKVNLNNNSTSHIVDCLYYNVLDNIPRDSQFHRREMLRYCISHENETIPTFAQGRPHTFGKLRQENVTRDLLYSWSTSIDLVEDYEIYLNNETKMENSSSVIFYNCSLGWFGRMCQYTFTKRLTLVQPTFADVVTQIFDIKLKETTIEFDKSPDEITLYSCYTHIKCERDLFNICLDWREICDGKVDCLNDGQDEMHCAELEMNDCSDNEYRCHNGVQCIPKEMFNDDKLNIDCLDSTDELEPLSDLNCVGDPSFRCEERSCRNSFLFSCGDGQCTKKPLLFLKNHIDVTSYCRNGRHRFVNKIILSRQANSIISYACWESMLCYFKDVDEHFSGITCFDHPCDNYALVLTEKCIQQIMYDCQSTPQFVFPQSSIGFLSEIDIVYDINSMLNSKSQRLEPTYLCFRNQRCAELINQSVNVANQSGCQRMPNEFLINKDIDVNLEFWFYNLIDFVRMCIPIDLTAINMTHCRSNNLLHCQVNQHCISKSRLMDGQGDCYSSLDEKDLLNDSNCLNIHKGITNEIEPLFSYLCDEFVDMDQIDNETDETHCEDWPCDNIYTRCDGIWNCLNGVDESNCKDSPCPSNTLPCLSPTNNTMICLSLSKMNDNKIDCRGATDERLFCRERYSVHPTYRYQCWNESHCIDTNRLCDRDLYQWHNPDIRNDCKYDDDEHFCPLNVSSVGICDSDFQGNRTIKDKILCDLADKYERGGNRVYRNELHLSLIYSGYYPIDLVNKTESIINMDKNLLFESKESNKFLLPPIDFETAWYCYRGISIMVGSKRSPMCLCPPSYYGSRCQYQNERVSLTLQFRPIDLSSPWRTIVFHFFILLIDDENTIHSYEEIIYSSIRDCNTKFNIYLLYKDQPKNQSRNYRIHIDAYIKNDLSYYGSWYLSVPFLFLPVNRISSIVTIPIRSSQHNCDKNVCGNHGRCIRYISSLDFFCQCDIGWKGRLCDIKRDNDDVCHCSSNSHCIEPGLCLCSLNKFGSRCYLTRSSCKFDKCSNHGLCISDDQRISESNFTCICNEGYWGKRCQYIQTQIDIYFVNILIPQSIHIHLIKAYENNQARHERTTTFNRIPLDKDFTRIRISSLFNILFVEFDKIYYLTVVQEESVLRNSITTEVNPSRRCLSIDNLLNSSELLLPILHRVKSYHQICRIHKTLQCFFDNVYMCLCNSERQVNCFSFDHDMIYNCQGRVYCQNDGKCYQDHPTCPTKLLCICSECFYGSQCQISTKDSSFSLDIILSYQIQPNISFSHQRSIVKVSLSIIILIFCLGFLNGILSIITFRLKQSQQVGCGIYLIVASFLSFIPLIFISLKFTFLFLTQTYSITNRIHIFLGCIIIDYILQITLNMGNWLNVCVAIERSISVWQGIHFNKIKSKLIARRVIIFLLIIIPLTSLHEPFYRQLIDDNDDDNQSDPRTLCITIYSYSMKRFDIIMNIFNLIAPFTVNIISGFIIIIVAARKRSTAQNQLSLKHHLKKQFDEHKHLLISPIIFIILSLPRLILSLTLGCMKSIRDPWLFLFGYFASFFPSMSIFITFVLPSDTYRKNFFAAIRPILLFK